MCHMPVPLLDGPQGGFIIELIGDQPQTCPRCGARTEFYDVPEPVSTHGLAELHFCLNPKCRIFFFAMDE